MQIEPHWIQAGLAVWWRGLAIDLMLATLLLIVTALVLLPGALTLPMEVWDESRIANNAIEMAMHGTAHHVVIKNLIVKNYTAPTQYGMIQIWGSYALIQNNEITGATQGAGVWASSYALVIANYIHHNAQEGYKVVYDGTASQAAVGTLFDSNEIAHNNPTHGYWNGGEQGGGKATGTQHLTFWYNYAHDNSGPSFWTDSDNIYTIYWYNKSRNDTNGIEHGLLTRARHLVPFRAVFPGVQECILPIPEIDLLIAPEHRTK